MQEGRKGEEEERYERKPKINRKTWNEFGKNDKGELRMILVEDCGVKTSTKRKTLKRLEESRIGLKNPKKILKSVKFRKKKEQKKENELTTEKRKGIGRETLGRNELSSEKQDKTKST